MALRALATEEHTEGGFTPGGFSRGISFSDIEKPEETGDGEEPEESENVEEFEELENDIENEESDSEDEKGDIVIDENEPAFEKAA